MTDGESLIEPYTAVLEDLKRRRARLIEQHSAAIKEKDELIASLREAIAKLEAGSESAPEGEKDSQEKEPPASAQ